MCEELKNDVIECGACGRLFITEMEGMGAFCFDCHNIMDEEDLMEEMYYDDEYDGQPSEYEEWQYYYGGDDCEYGTYGDYPGSEDW